MKNVHGLQARVSEHAFGAMDQGIFFDRTKELPVTGRPRARSLTEKKGL